ncbi:MAG: SPFH domain-containing protein [Polyangiaceae bacterium]|jgi:regulator of protease activity HflC (stomatin/prohibitin superfamily)|nr:SPFH domain-containing protein [Polyangiaceae bacterium]
MDPVALVFLIPFLALASIFTLGGMRQVNQWEAGLKFTLGRFTGRVEPGLRFLWPVFQRMIRIDTRIRTRDVPGQMVITHDNVTAAIDAVVYYRVVDPEKAALGVENYERAVLDRARVVLRDLVGEITLDQLLAHRDDVASKVRMQVDQFVARWGIHIETIALQDIQLPPTMQEAMAKKAIAEREKQWVIIKSQADLESAKNFAEAARVLYESPGAMELRRLEALQNITGPGNSKVIFDLAKPFEDSRSYAIGTAAALADDATPRHVRVPQGPPPPMTQPAVPTQALGSDRLDEDLETVDEALAELAARRARR